MTHRQLTVCGQDVSVICQPTRAGQDGEQCVHETMVVRFDLQPFLQSVGIMGFAGLLKYAHLLKCDKQQQAAESGQFIKRLSQMFEIIRGCNRRRDMGSRFR